MLKEDEFFPYKKILAFTVVSRFDRRTVKATFHCLISILFYFARISITLGFFPAFYAFFDPLTRASAHPLRVLLFSLLPHPPGPILSLAWNIPKDERKDPVINCRRQKKTFIDAEIRMHFLFNSVRNVTVPRETRSNKKMSIVESKIAIGGYLAGVNAPFYFSFSFSRNCAYIISDRIVFLSILTC